MRSSLNSVSLFLFVEAVIWTVASICRRSLNLHLHTVLHLKEPVVAFGDLSSLIRICNETKSMTLTQ